MLRRSIPDIGQRVDQIEVPKHRIPMFSGGADIHISAYVSKSFRPWGCKTGECTTHLGLTVARGRSNIHLRDAHQLGFPRGKQSSCAIGTVVHALTIHKCISIVNVSSSEIARRAQIDMESLSGDALATHQLPADQCFDGVPCLGQFADLIELGLEVRHFQIDLPKSR